MKKRVIKKDHTDLLLDIEKSTDNEDHDIAAHIPVLLETIGNLKLEKIDLTSKDTAEDAIAMLNEVIEKLSTYKNTASTLRQILENDESLPKKH